MAGDWLAATGRGGMAAGQPGPGLADDARWPVPPQSPRGLKLAAVAAGRPRLGSTRLSANAVEIDDTATGPATLDSIVR